MGGDGGCVPQRADMVKTRGFAFARTHRGVQGISSLANSIIFVGEEKIQPKDLRQFRMSHCRATSEFLNNPVVADRLGTLYNKEAVITMLLQKKIPYDLSYIAKLKDLKDVKVEFLEQKQKDVKVRNTGDGLSDMKDEEQDRRMMCPIANLELDDGLTRSVFFWHCGCVVSEKGLKVLTSGTVVGGPGGGGSTNNGNTGNGNAATSGSSSSSSSKLSNAKFKKCPVCSTEFEEEQSIIHLAPDQQELQHNISSLQPKQKEKVDKIIEEQKKRKREETGAGIQGQAKEEQKDVGDLDELPETKKRRKEEAIAKEKQELEAARADERKKNGKSDVWNTIFRPAEEIRKNARDGFGTGAMGRRF